MYSQQIRFTVQISVDTLAVSCNFCQTVIFPLRIFFHMLLSFFVFTLSSGIWIYRVPFMHTKYAIFHVFEMGIRSPFSVCSVIFSPSLFMLNWLQAGQNQATELIFECSYIIISDILALVIL